VPIRYTYPTRAFRNIRRRVITQKIRLSDVCIFLGYRRGLRLHLFTRLPRRVLLGNSLRLNGELRGGRPFGPVALALHFYPSIYPTFLDVVGKYTKAMAA
jgi:hypothetical protein